VEPLDVASLKLSIQLDQNWDPLKMLASLSLTILEIILWKVMCWTEVIMSKIYKQLTTIGVQERYVLGLLIVTS